VVADPEAGEPVKSAKKGKKSKKAKKAKAGRSAEKERKSDKRAKSGKKADPAPTAAQRFRGAGRATSDAILFNSSKRVALRVEVPKSVRDEIRQVARMSGAREDDLVSEILTAWLSEPRRW
jgi:hypothetical protein